ncbi:plant-specific TFIIB-related protein 1 [Dendrobium catenatum]|uniref:Transcription initiation factor IIB n=1 Tax=Dendrobium catenatum TaxID=906689 RepID=A0A2I0XGP7_9ASPA|nr:plant-specific TFIIB-related protein 1 [Dendrobium catenatum]PKU87089.1 Transcription initiation factor IIB [Dendrobium catenatum]
MFFVRCPYCPGTQGRCATTASGRHVTECSSCGRVIEERHTQTHHLFLLQAHDSALPLVTPDLASISLPSCSNDEDPFHPTGFITAFSTWSLEHSPVFARSAYSFAGHLAELERALDSSSSGSGAADPAGPMVSVDHLRAYLQIIDVSSILGLDHDVVDHAFQLFRDCCSATCLRNRSIEALATAALVHAIREAQEPRTLQEISMASNLPQKEIGKYIKILGEALKLSQPINSNSISVHMPRFCTLLQLNKSAQELAAHIGEVVINKCFCTRRNPISISAAAIYLACQLEDKRKTQAEICKVTGLTEVTLRKVYKELLENWDDLLPPNYTPAVPPEKAFPMTAITSCRSSAAKADLMEISNLPIHQEKDKHQEAKKPGKATDAQDIDFHQAKPKDADLKNTARSNSRASFATNRDLYQGGFWHRQFPFGTSSMRTSGEKDQKGDQVMITNETKCSPSNSELRVDKEAAASSASRSMGHGSNTSTPQAANSTRQLSTPSEVLEPPVSRYGKQQVGSDQAFGQQGAGNKSRASDTDASHCRDKK